MKQIEKDKSTSAYDEYLRSAGESTESDIEYFSSSHKKQPSAERDAKPAPRRAAARSAKPETKKKAPPPTAEQQKRREKRAEMKTKKQKEKDRLYLMISALLVTVLVFCFSLFTLATGDKQYSENENRYLATRPKLSASSLSDGSYMKDMERYLSDQFFGRSALVKARTKIDIFFGKTEVNQVYIGKNHYLFEKPEAYDVQKLAPTIESINAFTLKHKKIASYFALAPDASEVLSEYMPKNAPTQNQSEQIKTVYNSLDKKIKTVDICSTLLNTDNSKQLYYRSDHHWTTPAAEIAFKQIAANMKLDTGKINYKTYGVTNSFQGTLASSSGLFNAKDTIYVTVPETELKYVVSYTAENRKSASMFESAKLKEKNKYDVFFGGNFSEIHIDTTLNSKKVLLVVKDSYANCLVPMLMPYYKSIIMVDPRYFTGDMEKILKENAVTDVLWLYNVNTFLTDTSIKNVIK